MFFILITRLFIEAKELDELIWFLNINLFEYLIWKITIKINYFASLVMHDTCKYAYESYMNSTTYTYLSFIYVHIKFNNLYTRIIYEVH